MNNADFYSSKLDGLPVCIGGVLSVTMWHKNLNAGCPQRSPLSLADNCSRLCNFTAKPASASAGWQQSRPGGAEEGRQMMGRVEGNDISIEGKWRKWGIEEENVRIYFDDGEIPLYVTGNQTWGESVSNFNFDSFYISTQLGSQKKKKKRGLATFLISRFWRGWIK